VEYSEAFEGSRGGDRAAFRIRLFDFEWKSRDMKPFFGDGGSDIDEK
jgi:hypothetical protein